MADIQIVRVDGIKWCILEQKPRVAAPLCPDHDLKLTPAPGLVRRSVGSGYVRDSESNATELSCAEGPPKLPIPRKLSAERQYVLDRIDAKVFKNAKVLNLDDEALPIAKAKASSPNDKYFITAQLMESKRGLQAVIYAGEKGKPNKTQLFIDPETKKMSFDHKDLSPSDVFLKVQATFNDGSTNTIEK